MNNCYVKKADVRDVTREQIINEVYNLKSTLLRCVYNTQRPRDYSPLSYSFNEIIIDNFRVLIRIAFKFDFVKVSREQRPVCVVCLLYFIVGVIKHQ